MKTMGPIYFAILVSITTLKTCKTQTTVLTNSSELSNSSLSFLDGDFENHPYLVSLKYHLREEMLPELCTAIALREVRCSIKECNISFVDIVDAAQLSKYTTEDIAEALNSLNISLADVYNTLVLYDVSVGTVEKFLRTHSINLSEVYKNFVDSLPNPVQSIPDILNVLNISVLDFMSAQAYGNDTVKLQVLSTGSYSLSNIKKVLNIANKTTAGMLKLLPLNRIVSQLKAWDPTVIRNLIKNLGINSKNANDFYRRLGVTPITFLSYSPFIQMVTGLYELLNPEEVLGTAISSYTIVTNNKAAALSNYLNNASELAVKYFNFQAELVENPLIQYSIQNVTEHVVQYQSDDIALIQISERLAEFVEYAKDYNGTIGNCSYITKLPFGEEYSENITNVYLVNNTIMINKTKTTLFNLGSPLFCNNKLYCIASTENAQSIKFSTFIRRTVIKPLTTATISNAVTQASVIVEPKPSAGSTVKYTLNILISFVFVLYLQ